MNASSPSGREGCDAAVAVALLNGNETRGDGEAEKKDDSPAWRRCCFPPWRRWARKGREAGDSSTATPSHPSQRTYCRLSAGRTFALQSLTIWVLLCWPSCVATIVLLVMGSAEPTETDATIAGK